MDSYNGKVGLATVSDEEQNEARGVRAVLIVVLGTLMTELAMLLRSLLEGATDIVPWEIVVIDSISYDLAKSKLKAAGWTEEQIDRWLPGSHFKELENPFCDGFKFTDTGNARWASVVHDPVLQQYAAKSYVPGAAGLRALGNARVQASEVTLRGFFRDHMSNLTRVAPNNATLLPGLLTYFVTSGRGGTGCGGVVSTGAIARDVQVGGDVVLHMAMPDIFKADERARANAVAACIELQAFHTYEGKVPMIDKRFLQAPFSRVTMQFQSDGAHTITGRDALMLQAAVLMPYLKVQSQHLIQALRVDSTDARLYDRDLRPMQVSQEVAVSISVCPPGFDDFMGAEWILQETAKSQDQLEKFKRENKIGDLREKEVDALVDEYVKDLRLGRAELTMRIEPAARPGNAFRGLLDQFTSLIATMKGGQVREQIPSLVRKVSSEFEKLETEWKAKATALAEELPGEVEARVRVRHGHRPDLVVYLLRRIAERLEEMGAGIKKDADELLGKRRGLNDQLGQAISAVQNARSWIPFMADEVVRNAALAAVQVADRTIKCRIAQHQAQYLAEALASTQPLGGAGEETTPCAVSALKARALQVLSRNIVQLQARKEQIEKQQAVFCRRFENRSRVFQRSLIHDGDTRAEMVEEVQKLRKQGDGTNPEILKFLKDEQDLDTTIRALKPLLPGYADSKLTLQELLETRPKCRDKVVDVIQSCRPFAPTDLVIEAQHNLKDLERDTVRLLEIPGGDKSELAEVLRRNGALDSRTRIVDSNNNEIRYYMTREGLPFWCMSTLRRWRADWEKEQQRPNAPSLYTVPSGHELGNLEPPDVNLKDYLVDLMSRTQAVFPERLERLTSGGLRLRYTQGHASNPKIKTIQTETFPDQGAMIGWLAKRPALHRELRAALVAEMDAKPKAYKKALLEAWAASRDEEERQHLYNELVRLGVDPNSVTVKTSVKAPVRIARAAGRGR